MAGLARPHNAPINVRITAPTASRAGEYITLRCGSQANPVVNSYSWRKLCGSQSTDLRRYRAEYRLRATVEAGTCDYFCTARNSLGGTESPAQRIDVQYAPINVRITAPTAPRAGENITLRCGSQANPVVNSYSWRKLCGSQSTDLRGDGAEYRLWTTVEAGTCEYFCTARNSLGEKESPAQRIDVQYAPINVKITAPTAPPVGENITLRCESQANPVVNYYSWRKLCGSQSTDLQRDDAEYRLRATVEVWTCEYFCTANNSLSGTESPAQRIDVQLCGRDRTGKYVVAVIVLAVFLGVSIITIAMFWAARCRNKRESSVKQRKEQKADDGPVESPYQELNVGDRDLYGDLKLRSK